jgi:putative ABC transport system permease protein
MGDHWFLRAVRGLARAPLFTTIAVATLAVGIGANAAIFSIVNGVLLKPLPYDDAGRLVGVWHTAPGLGFPLMNMSPAMYFTYREEGRVFDDIGMWDTSMVSVTGVGEPERVSALFVSEATLPILRIRMALGRTFTADEDTASGPDRVVLGYAYWQRKFGSDPRVLGRVLTIEGKPREVVGVLPQGFRFLTSTPAVVLPLRFDRSKVFIGNFSFQAIARLKKDSTIEQANADVARMIPLSVERFPLPPGFTRQMFDDVRLGPNVRPLKQDLIGDVQRVLWVLLGTVGLVLLIACANVANLFLVRAEGRQRELAIRAALGADWRRIAGAVLSEGVVLATFGGLVGLCLAYAGIRVLVALGPESLPRLDEITIDIRVLLFTIGVSAFSALLFGLLPSLKYARPRIVSALVEGGRSVSDGRERHAVRNGLAIAQIALALVLLVASGLMIRTFVAMRHVDPGFVRPNEVLTIRVAIPEALVGDPEQTVRVHEQITHRIEQIPGVQSVGLSSAITMDGSQSNDPIFVEEFPSPEGQIPPIRRFKWVSDRYFQTMGNPIIAGHGITWADTYAKTPIAVVSEGFVRHYWKTPAAAIGRRIRQSPKNPWREIIGVVRDERDDGVNRPAPAIVYWPMLQKDFWDEPLFVSRNMAYAIRTARTGSPTLLQEVQQAVWSVNPNLPLASVRTLDEILAASMAQTSFALIMLAIAGGVALLLGLVGIYGVTAYIASQRVREVGIRVALGAQPGDVVRMFLRHGLLLAGVGLVLGVAAASGLTSVMTTLLYGVRPIDPITYVTVAAALGSVAIFASYLPARRASRLDPVLALRAE